ncbi:MAG: hypothetical protein ACRDQB_04760, partial [Thermocrispum sp.]
AAPGVGGKSGGGAMGPGKGSGVGAPGSGPGGATAAQAARSGLAGRGAGPGMMGGAGAGRGNDDDKEHKDKYALPEELDTGVQVEVDEYGERIIDEQSGNTVVPEVIGKADYEQDENTTDEK